MIYLILNILVSTAIVIIFKYIERLKIDTFIAIVINYFTCLSLGYLLSDTSQLVLSDISKSSWLFPAIIIGVNFIVIFNMIGLTSQKIGISVASITGKMSVIIPILFSILYYSEPTNYLKISGIVLAIFAVTLTIIRKQSLHIDRRLIFLPILLFLGTGATDILIKYTEQEYLNEALLPIFTAILFTISSIIGIIYSIVKGYKLKHYLSLKTILAGIILGLCNYGSIYFFLKALKSSGIDSSIVFGLNNIGVVALSVIFGLFLFQERLTKLNWLGFFLSIIAITILANC